MTEKQNDNKKTIVYIGDFDFKNENVQSHLVKNNSKIIDKLGYAVFFIGVDRTNNKLRDIKKIKSAGNYLELPYSLSFKGFFKRKAICQRIIQQLDELNDKKEITHVITYQSPTYAIVLKRIAIWCIKKDVKYIVNCADIPIFDAQPFVKRFIMKWNWSKIHKINKKYADGVIAVSSYIEKFYYKSNRKSVIIPPLFDKNSYQARFKDREKTVSFVYAGTPFIKTIASIKPSGMKDRLDRIIDLFDSLSIGHVEYNLKIVGIDLSDYLIAIPRHKVILENNKRIVFLGRRSHEETLEIISNSDFSINYRDSNIMNMAGFSTKIVESVSLGTPIITNETSDIKRYVRKNNDWFELGDDNKKNAELLFRLSHLSQSDRRTLKSACLMNNSFCTDTYADELKDFLAG